MNTLSNTLPHECDGLGCALDAVEPLPCDRWLAASALQKAIRRADALTAGRAREPSIDTIPAQPGAG